MDHETQVTDAQVAELMSHFPRLDRMMCETLLKTPPQRLREYIESESKTLAVDPNRNIQSVTISEK